MFEVTEKGIYIYEQKETEITTFRKALCYL